MNDFLSQSIELANQGDYLDQLLRVYPMNADESREIVGQKWEDFKEAFRAGDDEEMISALLDFELFPIKDSYVAFLRRDRGAMARNPLTISRLARRLRELGLDKIYDNLAQPKESNRQIGPLFKAFIKSKFCDFKLLKIDDFVSSNEDAILDASDALMMSFARESLNYERQKGLDFVARMRGKIIIGEAKFLSDFGGHQNAQLEDALGFLNTKIKAGAIKILILDGVCYLNKNKMFKTILNYKNENIFSALLLRSFLNEV